MPYAVVKNAAGDNFAVNNTVQDSDGNPFVVDVYAYDSDGNPFLIFTDGITTVPKEEFDSGVDRKFYAVEGGAMTFDAIKAPAEILDYMIDWSEELELSDPTDQIATSVWSIQDASPENLTILAESIDGTDTSVVRVSGGGRLGIKHRLRCLATGISGLIHQRTIVVTMTKR